jgi:SAM-dependent methyltransferase
MEDEATPRIRKPSGDDRPLWDILFGVWGLPAVLVAHEIKLFAALADRALTLDEVCRAKGLKRRPAEALLSVAASLGLVRLASGRYSLTPVAEDYFLESGVAYFGGLLDLTVNNYPVWSVESLKRAVLTDAPQVYGGSEVFKSHEEQAELARAFTRATNSASMAPATAWPDTLDLAQNQLMLDIGGGSGAHCLGALHRWPHLKAVVFDIAPVCEVAREFAVRYALADRIGTHAGDMWKDPFPSADIHFYSMIFHDWPAQKCRFLANRSFESLKPGGRIIVHEMLFNDQRTGPFPVAAFNIDMLLWVEGEQYSGGEISAMLSDAGFKNIEVKPTFGYWSIVTGTKR